MPTPVYVLTINGATVRPLRLGFDIREVANGRNRMTLSLFSATGAPPIALFDTVALTEDGVLIFGGYVDAPTEAGAGGEPITPTITTVSVVDYNQLAERRAINLTFPAGTLKSQLQTLLTTFGDVTLDPAQPAGPLLPEWSAVYWRADDVLNQFTTLSGGYLWNIGYTRVLSMRAPTATLAPVAITDANRVAIGDVTVTPSAADYANRVLLLYGGDGVGPTDDRWTGDGTTVAFPVRNFHVSNAGYVTVGGVNETLGAGATWTLSPDGRTLTRIAAPAVGALIIFPYNALFPTLVTADAPGGILTPPGFWEVIVRAPDVKTYAVAVPMAVQEVAVRSARPRTIVYRTFERGLHPGQSQAITKSARHLAAVPTVISEVTIRNATGRDADRIVTAIEGSQFPGTWRDMIKGWNDTGGGSSGFVSGGGGGGGGGTGAVGPGTPGTLAVFTGTSAVGDSILSQSGGVVTVAGGLVATTLAGNGAAITNLNASALTSGTVAAARLPQFVGGDVVTAAPGSVNLQLVAGAVGAADIAAGAISNVHIAAGAGISWSKIDKTGAVLADLGGTLSWPQLPAGAGTWTGTPTITGVLSLTSHLYAVTPYTSDVGQLTKKMRAIYGAELWVETLVAQQTIATIGGRVLVGPTNILTADLAATDTTIFVKYNNFVAGDMLYLEENGQAEWMRVTSPVAGSGPFLFNVDRNAITPALLVARAWPAGAAILNTGSYGKGYIDLYALSGIFSGAGPTIVGNVRTGPGYNDVAPRWAIGNLNGVTGYGYTTDIYGAAFGDPTHAWLKIDPTYGVRIGYNTTIMASIDASGNATFSGTIRVGPTPTNQYVTLTAVDTFTGGTGAAIQSTAGFWAATDMYAGTGFTMPGGSGSVGGASLYAYATATRYALVSHSLRGTGFAPVAEVGGTNTYAATTCPLLVASVPYNYGTRTPVIASGYALDVRGAARFEGNTHIADGYQLFFDGAAFVVAGSFYGFLINNNANDRTILQLTNGGDLFVYNGVQCGGQIRASGWYSVGAGLALELGISGGGVIIAYNRTAGVYSQLSLQSLNSILNINQTTGFAFSVDAAAHYQQQIDNNGDWRPDVDGARRVGVPACRYGLVRAVTITSGDLSFENGWTITEAERVGIADEGLAILDADQELIAFIGRAGFERRRGVGADDVDARRYVRTTPAQRAKMDRHPEERLTAIYEPQYDERGQVVRDPISRKPRLLPRMVPKGPAELPMPDPTTGRTNRQYKGDDDL